MTNREKLSKMSDEEFAEWLCKQMWTDYKGNNPTDIMRYHQVRNFLKAEAEEGGR